MRQYSVLPRRPLQSQTSFHTPCQDLPPRVTLDDPAVAVMTDFKKATAFTIDPDVSVDTAARVMRRRKVHLLLVVDVENILRRLREMRGQQATQVIGHVVATLKASGRRHAAVVDEDAGGHQILRGLLSCSQIALQLGEPVETTEIAQNFAEISAALHD